MIEKKYSSISMASTSSNITRQGTMYGLLGARFAVYRIYLNEDSDQSFNEENSGSLCRLWCCY